MDTIDIGFSVEVVPVQPGDSVTIDDGAPIFIDMRFERWPDVEYGKSGLVFTVDKSGNDGYWWLEAENFGKRGFYGNGRLCVAERYLTVLLQYGAA